MNHREWVGWQEALYMLVIIKTYHIKGSDCEFFLKELKDKTEAAKHDTYLQEGN